MVKETVTERKYDEKDCWRSIKEGRKKWKETFKWSRHFSVLCVVKDVQWSLCEGEYRRYYLVTQTHNAVISRGVSRIKSWAP
jgi:hypothetical protein